MKLLWFIIVAVWAFAVAAAPARGLGEARVTARLAPDGVRASILLDRPVTRFRFAPADVVREGEFQLLSPGLSLEGDEVVSARPFRRFELLVKPMTRERDAKYPAHYRVGSGGVLYGPALVADPATWKTRLVLIPARGEVRRPATGNPAHGFTYLGPAALAAEQPEMTVVSAPDTPAWLVERARSDLAAAVRTFASSLRIPLPHKPLLVLSHDDDRSGIVADVSRPASVTIRFHGSQWREATGGEKQIQELILHEAFHLWNGALAKNGPDTPAWLHEGGAEYASLLAGHAADTSGDVDVRRRLGQALTKCRDALKERPLAEAELIAQVRYPCGMALQWVADLSVRQSTAGERNVLDSWGEVIANALRRADRSYTVADFYKASGFSAERLPSAMSLMLQEKGTERWQRLPAALEEIGAKVVVEADPARRLPTLIFHILKQHCEPGQPIGFFGEPGAIKLDTEGRCGSLAGAPRVTVIEGRPVDDPTSLMFEAVAAKCAAADDVSFTTREGKTLTARCAKPLPPAPLGFVVKSWRPGPDED